jgi:hypothetical protein
MKKRDVLELLHGQPEDLDVDRFIYALYIRHQIQCGFAVPDAEREYTPENFQKLDREWTVAGYGPRPRGETR